VRSLVLILLLLTGQAVAQTPGFWLVGTAPGTPRSQTFALSQNGTVAAGYSIMTSPPFALPGFTWTPAGGRYDFGLEPGMPLTTAAAGLSSDGSTIVGFKSDLTTNPRAFRRVGNGPLQDLGAGPYERSYASGVSGDGSVVVGHGEFTQFGQPFGQAFRWTEQGGMQFLGVLHAGSRISVANGGSRDGGTVVGYNDGIAPEAFVWRQGTGIQPLPPLPGGSTLFSSAGGVNADGSVIVGDVIAADNMHHAVRWLAAGPEDLGLGAALAVSDNGLVVVGVNQFVWTSVTGRTTLPSYLGLFGVTIPAGWTPRDIFAVSGDGRTFAGEAVSTSGAIQGFVATIPAPATGLMILVPALVGSRRRRAAA
jgi:uncharacterized membrane protein